MWFGGFSMKKLEIVLGISVGFICEKKKISDLESKLIDWIYVLNQSFEVS